ncbi:hypothetical protein [Halorussus sp. AFM4]|uniref:hypothetical protein n=1 Tax=Halorussus sp. AFM4 TaxID=3421651 RepID=UPI003EB9BE95
MTRFDAATPAERRKLFAEAIAAHRERGSPFATFEADADASALATGDGSDGSEAETGASDRDDAEADDPEELPPWIQFGDGVLNLDCTESELDDLKSVLGEFPAFKIDDITRPEEAEGVNVRVSALADPNRVAQCVDRVFREVYGQHESFRAWVAAV